MAGAFSDHTEGAILNWIKGTTFPAAPTTLYVGLFTTIPADTGLTGSPSDGTEASGTSYARVAVTSSSGWSAISASTTTQLITNAGTITFPTAGGSWGTIVGIGIWDASTSGNLLFYCSVTSQAIANGNTASVAASALTISVD